MQVLSSLPADGTASAKKSGDPPCHYSPPSALPPAARARKHPVVARPRSEEHTSELQSQSNLVWRPLLDRNQADRSNRFTSRALAIGDSTAHRACKRFQSCTAPYRTTVTER